MKVGIAGCGGIGSNVAYHLIRSGIVEFKFGDFDIVESSNLNRQFFFSFSNWKNQGSLPKGKSTTNQSKSHNRSRSHPF